MAKNNSEDYTKQLEERLAALEAALKEKDIRPAVAYTINDNNRDIVVTSLTVGLLNVSTEGYGAGEIYSFKSFGEEMVIPYEDVKQIIKHNKSFINGGKLFINDEELIKSQKLTKVYERILSADAMLKLFGQNKKGFKKVFENLPKAQKETFKEIIFNKLKENQDVDMNIVQVVNESLNIDIMKMFKESQDLFKEND